LHRQSSLVIEEWLKKESQRVNWGYLSQLSHQWAALDHISQWS